MTVALAPRLKAQVIEGWLRHSAFATLIVHSMIYRRGSSLIMDTL